jgi:riboflavin synthase
VEGTGRIENIRADGETSTLTIRVASDFSSYLVAKGSVAVDGVSLTIVDPGPSFFRVVLIPETVEKTTFPLKRLGDFVNLEPDLILKYVISAVGNLAGPHRPGEVTFESLRRSGFITEQERS